MECFREKGLNLQSRRKLFTDYIVQWIHKPIMFHAKQYKHESHEPNRANHESHRIKNADYAEHKQVFGWQHQYDDNDNGNANLFI